MQGIGGSFNEFADIAVAMWHGCVFMTEIAVAVVNHNTREHLGNCLATVLREAPREIVVIDNASTDGSVEMMRREYPEVRLVANATNPGYGAAANQAVAA